MSATAYVSGNLYPEKVALRALGQMLTFIGMRVAHPLADGSFLRGDRWLRYEMEVDYYRTIANSAFYVVYCDNTIDEQTGLQIMYAMLNRRPIVLTGEPQFAANLSFFIRETLDRHKPTFHRVSLIDLELSELSFLLAKLKPLDYLLSEQEKVLIRARLRQSFRRLIED